MLKYDEIKSFSEWDDEIDTQSAHDKNAVELEKNGHRVVCLGRALATVEQCESNAECPFPYSDDALKVTIHADKDLAADEPPHELFISANRWGSSEVVLKIGGRTFKAHWKEDGL